ncbi:MAG: hypothetical protein AB1733_25085 [Thermodesulfobacteriota bacterium]
MIVISDPDAAVRNLAAIIGQSRLDERLKEFERQEGQLQPNSVYAQWWFAPQNALWLTLRGARQCWNVGQSINRVIDQVPPIGISAALLVAKVYPTMPQWRQAKFVADLVSSEQLQSVLLELEAAADLIDLGYDIEWLDDRGREGKRSAEFVASRAGYRLGVECKASAIDSGRLLHRKYACQLADDLLNPLSQARGLTGDIQIIFHDAAPKSLQARASVAQRILDAVDAQKLEENSPGFLVKHTLRERDGTAIDLQNYSAAQRTIEADYFRSFTVIAARLESNKPCDPIVFRFGSSRQDRIMRAVKENLRTATEQVGALDCPGFITCFVPEIPDFDGEETRPFVNELAEWFFGNPQRSHVLAIRLVSDFKVDDLGAVNFAQAPFAMIKNPARIDEAEHAFASPPVQPRAATL